MKLDIRYINKAKPRKTLTLSFTEDVIYPSHTLDAHGFSPYVSKRNFDDLVDALKQVAKTGNAEHAEDILKEYKLN